MQTLESTLTVKMTTDSLSALLQNELEPFTVEITRNEEQSKGIELFVSLIILNIIFNYRLAQFLSPARRGRGILVAPGFCPVSRFLVGSKTQKQFFLKF